MTDKGRGDKREKSVDTFASKSKKDETISCEKPDLPIPPKTRLPPESENVSDLTNQALPSSKEQTGSQAEATTFYNSNANASVDPMMVMQQFFRFEEENKENRRFLQEMFRQNQELFRQHQEMFKSAWESRKTDEGSSSVIKSQFKKSMTKFGLKEELKFENWIQRFEVWIDPNLTESEKKHVFIEHLEGKASDFFNSLPEQNEITYSKLIDLFRKEFQDKRSPMVKLAHLFTQNQAKENLTIEEYLKENRRQVYQAVSERDLPSVLNRDKLAMLATYSSMKPALRERIDVESLDLDFDPFLKKLNAIEKESLPNPGLRNYPSPKIQSDFQQSGRPSNWVFPGQCKFCPGGHPRNYCSGRNFQVPENVKNANQRAALDSTRKIYASNRMIVESEVSDFEDGEYIPCEQENSRPEGFETPDCGVANLVSKQNTYLPRVQTCRKTYWGNENGIRVRGLNQTCRIMLDTGAQLSLITREKAEEVMKYYRTQPEFAKKSLNRNQVVKMFGFNESCTVSKAVINLCLDLYAPEPYKTLQATYYHPCAIIDRTSSFDVILGMDFLEKNGFRLSGPNGLPLMCSELKCAANHLAPMTTPEFTNIPIDGQFGPPIPLTKQVELCQESFAENQCVEVAWISRISVSAEKLAPSLNSEDLPPQILFEPHPKGRQLGLTDMLLPRSDEKTNSYDLYVSGNAVSENDIDFGELGSFAHGDIKILGSLPITPLLDKTNSGKETSTHAYDSSVTPDGIGKAALSLTDDLKLKLNMANVPLNLQGSVSKLLSEFKEKIFSHSDLDIGRTHLCSHKIELLDGAKPVKQKCRYTSQAQHKSVEQEVESMLKRGVIVPCQSEWASPIVLVAKKDGTIRFCIDYRVVNRLTKLDSYPVPCIQETLTKFQGATVFSTFDLASGYWQVPMDVNSEEITSFICHLGTFMWKVMPFGLVNSGATMQRMVETVFGHLIGKCCFIYVDDLIVYSQNPEEHLSHLKLVFEAMVKARLKAKPKKCELFKDSVCYLGHRVSKNGIEADDSKFEKVKSFPIPKSKTELQSALGLFNYFKGFVKNYSMIARPLQKMTGVNQEFQWMDNHQTAFEELKKQITSSPILAHPDFEKPFCIEVDASKVGFGAVLLQKSDEDKKFHPIAFASEPTTVAQSRLSSPRLEAKAILWAVKHFRYYIDQHDTTVFTDCQAMIPLFNSPQKHHAIFNETVLLQAFPYVKIKHKPGKLNSCADALSRVPNPNLEQKSGIDASVNKTEVDTLCTKVGKKIENFENRDILFSTISAACAVPLGISESEFVDLQDSDPEIGYLKKFLESGQKPVDPNQQRVIETQANKYILVGKILCRRFWHNNVPYIPLKLRWKVLKFIHEGEYGSHASTKSMCSLLKGYVWWPGIWSDCEEYASSCIICARYNHGHNKQPPLYPNQTSRPFQRVEIDVTQLPTSRKGYNYILSFIDVFTKWPEAVALKKFPDAKTTAKYLKELIVSRHGVPELIQTDNGSNFTSEFLEQTVKILGIEKSHGFTYTPRCQGNVERFQGTLKRIIIKQKTNFPHRSWEEMLPAILFAYRCSIHQSTQNAPFFLLYGRQPNLPLGVKTSVDLRPGVSVDQHAAELERRMIFIWDKCEKKLKANQEKRKVNFDKTRAKMPNIRLHDFVMLLNPTVKGKFAPQYDGPYEVVGLSNTGAKIKMVHPNCDTPCTECEFVMEVSFHRLKPYKPKRDRK